jgi:hypothetical protein
MALGCKGDRSIIVSLLLGLLLGLQGFIDWYISNEADSVETNNIHRLLQLYEIARILNKEF